MTEGALFDRMEVCLRTFVAILAYIPRNHDSGLFMHNLFSRNRSAAWGPVVTGLVAGHARSHEEAGQVIDPVPRCGDNQGRKKKQKHMGLGYAHPCKSCAQL